MSLCRSIVFSLLVSVVFSVPCSESQKNAAKKLWEEQVKPAVSVPTTYTKEEFVKCEAEDKKFTLSYTFGSYLCDFKLKVGNLDAPKLEGEDLLKAQKLNCSLTNKGKNLSLAGSAACTATEKKALLEGLKLDEGTKAIGYTEANIDECVFIASTGELKALVDTDKTQPCRVSFNIKKPTEAPQIENRGCLSDEGFALTKFAVDVRRANKNDMKAPITLIPRDINEPSDDFGNKITPVGMINPNEPKVIGMPNPNELKVIGMPNPNEFKIIGMANPNEPKIIGMPNPNEFKIIGMADPNLDKKPIGMKVGGIYPCGEHMRRSLAINVSPYLNGYTVNDSQIRTCIYSAAANKATFMLKAGPDNYEEMISGSFYPNSAASRFIAYFTFVGEKDIFSLWGEDYCEPDTKTSILAMIAKWSTFAKLKSYMGGDWMNEAAFEVCTFHPRGWMARIRHKDNVCYFDYRQDQKGDWYTCDLLVAESK